MSLRIVLTSPYAWPEVRRGGERYVHELAAALAGAGHRPRILTAAPSPGRDEVLGVPVRRLRRRRVRGARYGPLAHEAGFGLQALAHLATARLDVWHAVGAADGAAAATLSRLRPGVRSVYTDIGFPAAASRAKRPDGGLHRRAAERIDEYVCISEAAGAYLRTDWDREPRVVSPGVDLAAFQPADTRHPHPALLFASDADEPRKHLPLLLEAVALLRARIPDVELWLLGPGDPSPALAAAPPGAADAVTVARLADLDELRERYARAWVSVLPSTAEAFGLVVVESLACGTPAVVRADGGGPPEILAGHPEAGAVIAGSAADLADGCARALELAAQPDTAAACRAVAQRYDWRTSVVPQLEEVYAGGRA